MLANNMNNETYKIEHNVPFPEDRARKNTRSADYPFAKLAIGDSFFVPSRRAFISQDRPLYEALQYARRVTSFHLEWRREKGGYRIYRRP
jgi:hypothetical protein